MARRAEHRDAVSGLDRASHQTASGRAAGQEATPQALPADDHTPASTTSAVGPASARRLTSCHSDKSLKPFKSVEMIRGYSKHIAGRGRFRVVATHEIVSYDTSPSSPCGGADEPTPPAACSVRRAVVQAAGDPPGGGPPAASDMSNAHRPDARPNPNFSLMPCVLIHLFPVARCCSGLRTPATPCRLAGWEWWLKG